MLEYLENAWRTYPAFYAEAADEAWRDIGPAEYGTLLIMISLFGWILMKRGAGG